MKWEAKFPKKYKEAFAKFPRIRSDRQIVSGTPCVGGRRIPVWVIAGRFAAGETIAFIACDYGIEPPDVREAIRFALWVSDLRAVRFWKFYHEQTEQLGSGPIPSTLHAETER